MTCTFEREEKWEEVIPDRKNKDQRHRGKKNLISVNDGN